MKSHRIISVAGLTLAAVMLNACSGGSEGTGHTGGGGGGNPDAMAFGAVTQLGSVYVNDVRYVTSNATVTIDDNPGIESDLRVGQTVVVSGSINDDNVNGTANSVIVESVVKGPVDVVYNGTTRVLIVLGQTIQVSDLTVIDDSLAGGVAGLNVDDEIKIHGHVRGNGVIEATLIEDSNEPLTEYKVIGFAQGVGAITFNIGNLTIDYSGADVSDLNGGMPTVGQLIEVKGVKPLSAGTLVATKVEPAGVSSANVPYVEIEGFVTVFSSSASFTVGNIPVITSASTVFEGGLPEDISLGSKLEVDGQLSNGTLVASKVQFRYNVKIEGNVASYTGTTMTIVGLGGITVNIDGLTETDGTPTEGNEVRLRGYKTGNTTVNATRVEDRGPGDPTPRTILQAPVDSEVSGSSITMLGVIVNTTGGGFEFRDINDMPLSSSAFYNLVDVGTLVKARGDYNDGTMSIEWDQAELEN